MNWFRDYIERINRAFTDLDSEDLTNAWIDAYESVNRIGAYFLYEDGFELGDAKLEDAIIDAKDRCITVPEEIDEDFTWQDWFKELIDSMNSDFVEFYKEDLYDTRQERKDRNETEE